MLNAPRTDKKPRTIIIPWDGSGIPVEYVYLTSREDRECRDEATIFTGTTRKFSPFLYLELRRNRMVLKIGDEAIDKDSHVWLELDAKFGDALLRALFPNEESFPSGYPPDALGPGTEGPTN